MEESYKQGEKQWSCIASPKSKNVHCFIPKSLPNKKKIQKYRDALRAKESFGKNYHYSSCDTTSSTSKCKKATDFDLMVKNDFHHEWIKKKDYKTEQKDTKSKTSDAMDAKIFGNVDSIKRVIPDLDRSRFCQRNIQGYNDPTNPAMAADCTKRLNSKIPFHDIPYVRKSTLKKGYETAGSVYKGAKKLYKKYYS